jgi:uncharacterized protein (TIGR02646 family)
MKYIQKSGSPHKYSEWRARVAGTPKADFREMPKEQKGILLTALIQEQGSLCAYTMRRIEGDSSHVEHIRPQSVCRAERAGSDLEFNNLVACFPREDLKSEYSYGAKQKGGWWINGGANFVSPLQPVCEKRFRFDREGKISAVQDNVAASTTIKVLRLDHPSLTEDRRRAIREFIYGRSGDEPLSGKRARSAIAAVCNRGGYGHFAEFCIAIRHALEDHLVLLQKTSKRKKFAVKRRQL